MATDQETLETRVANLEARVELYQMFSALAPTIDGGGSDTVAAFFAENAEYRTDVPGIAPTVGREQIAAVFRNPTHVSGLAGGISHALSFPHITVVGDKAEVVAHSVVHLRDETGWRVARVASNLFRCARRDGRWEIVSRDNRVLGTDGGRALFAEASYDLPWHG